MPDDHESCNVIYTSDSINEFMAIPDISDVNYGKDMDDDIDHILNPHKYEFANSEFSGLFSPH